MFRSVSIAAVLAIASVSAASAADMQLKAPPRLAAPVADSWGGPYIGIHGGYAWTRDNVGSGLISIEDAFTSTKPAGGLFGAQAGLRFQRNVFVFGIEVDYTHLGLKDQNAVGDVEGPTATTGVKVHDLASARATLGFELTQNLLIGASAGLGFGHTSAFVTDGKTSLTADANSWGWVAGAFGELKLPIFENVFLRAEYLHYDLGQVNYAIATLPFAGHPRADVVRAAISYRFP